MEIKPTWRSSLMLIWLLAAEQVTPAPTAAKPAPAPLRTQYPPAEARVAAPQTQGVRLGQPDPALVLTNAE